MARKKIPPAPPEQPQIDKKAEKEVEAFSSDTYAEASRKAEYDRSEIIKWVFHWVAVVIFLGFVGIYLVFLACWGFHLATPETRHFLTATQIDKLQSIVLSGVVASAFAKYYDKYMK